MTTKSTLLGLAAAAVAALLLAPVHDAEAARGGGRMSSFETSAGSPPMSRQAAIVRDHRTPQWYQRRCKGAHVRPSCSGDAVKYERRRPPPR